MDVDRDGQRRVWPVVAGLAGVALATVPDPLVVLAALPGAVAVYSALGMLRSPTDGTKGRAWLALVLGGVALFASAMGVWGLAHEIDAVGSEPPITSCELSPFCDDQSP